MSVGKNRPAHFLLAGSFVVLGLSLLVGLRWISRRSPDEPPPEQPTVADSGEDDPLVFESPEVALGPVTTPIRHSFRYKNAGASPLTLVHITPSCACTVLKPDKMSLAPGEEGSVGLEVDITKKEPGLHRFAITIDYECLGRHSSARASVAASYEPPVRIVPGSVQLETTGLKKADGEFMIVDHRPTPMTINRVSTSSPALHAELAARPKEYVGGWRLVFAVRYDPAKDEAKSGDVSGTVFVQTSCLDHPTMSIPVVVSRRERLRAAPATVVLPREPGGAPPRVVVRDSLGEQVEIDSVACDKTVRAAFERAPAFAPNVSFSLAIPPADSGGFPVTAVIRVTKPCAQDIPVTIRLADSAE